MEGTRVGRFELQYLLKNQVISGSTCVSFHATSVGYLKTHHCVSLPSPASILLFFLFSLRGFYILLFIIVIAAGLAYGMQYIITRERERLDCCTKLENHVSRQKSTSRESEIVKHFHVHLISAFRNHLGTHLAV